MPMDDKNLIHVLKVIEARVDKVSYVVSELANKVLTDEEREKLAAWDLDGLKHDLRAVSFLEQ